MPPPGFGRQRSHKRESGNYSMSGTSSGKVATIPSNLPAAGQPSVATPGVQDSGADRHTSVATFSDDPDEAVLAAARAEAEAEDRAASAAPAAPTQQKPPQQAAAPAAPAARPTQQQPIMVPKGRLDEALRAKQAADAEIAYLRGALEARTAMAQPAVQPTGQPAVQPQPQAQPTAQQIIANQNQRILTAAKQFDEGEITMAQFVSVQSEANGIITQVREQALMAAVPAPVTMLGIADQNILQTQLAQLEQAHPWTKVLSTQELQWLATIARQEAEGLGTPIGVGPAETVRLRTAVAQLSDVYGPRWYPHRVAPAPGATQQQQPARQRQQPTQQPSPQVQAAQRKLGVAAQHPPNINHAGAPGNSADLISDEQVAMMTTDEIEALPPQVRQRILSSG